MPEWTICPHCSLKHGRRPDGNCPRCKQPVAGADDPSEADATMAAVYDGRALPATRNSRQAAAVERIDWEPSSPRGGLILWIMCNPPVASVLFLVLALFTFKQGLADGKT
jgi:hypothetical protein